MTRLGGPGTRFRGHGRRGECRSRSRAARVSERPLEPPSRRPRSLYRLAAARLADPETREQGIGLLERAFDLDLDPERAAKLLQQIPSEVERDPRVAVLRERLARASGDTRGLVKALAIRASLPDASVAAVREGFELAQKLGDKELAAELARAALENKALSLEAHDWGVLRLDWRPCTKPRVIPRARSTCARTPPPISVPRTEESSSSTWRRAEAMDEHERALRLYGKVLDDTPAERRALGPALALYRKLGKRKEWLTRVEHAISLVETVEERSVLRLEQAHALLDQKGGKRRPSRCSKSSCSTTRAGEKRASSWRSSSRRRGATMTSRVCLARSSTLPPSAVIQRPAPRSACA